MGLFKQDVVIKIDNTNNIVERKVLDLKKGTIVVKVEENTMAIMGTEKLIGGQTYKYSKKAFGDTVTVLVYQKNRSFDAISFNFTSGEYTMSLDELEGAKAKYCLNGTVSVELFNVEKIAKYFNRDVTVEDVVKELQNTVREAFATEVRAIASKYITANTTVNSVYQEFDNIKKEIAGKNMAAIQKLIQMGLDLSSAGIALKLTPVDNTEELVNRVTKKINENALEQLDDIKADKERAQRLEEKEMDQTHEVNVIRAQNTTISETKVDSNVPLNGDAADEATKEKFCKHCGTKIALNAKFCPNCGRNVEEV